MSTTREPRNPPARFGPRYTLRRLLLAIALAAGLLAWWVYPVRRDVLRDDGTLAARFTVRRDWRGNYRAAGLQSWYLPDGQCFRQQHVHGAMLAGGELVAPGNFGPPLWLPHRRPDPPTYDYIRWLRHDAIPISTDLPSSEEPRDP